MKLAIHIVFLSLLFFSCSDSKSTQLSMTLEHSHDALLTELSDEEYPDNPDISIRHEKYVETTMESIEFREKEDLFDIIISPSTKEDDTVVMQNISLMEFIPTIPDCAKDDGYMALISVVNQEWNRNQVRWEGKSLLETLPKKFTVNGEEITRIDLARNCLNSYLWELFFYADVDGLNKVFYHGWFDFPRDLYQELFEKRNATKFDDFAEYMEDWKDPHNEFLQLDRIREVLNSSIPEFVDYSDEMYPLKGERLKKKIDIVYPETFSRMSDFHTDSSRFATFSQPGFYNRNDPRKTELGRFKHLQNVEYRNTKSTSKNSNDELSFEFTRDNGEVTYFVFGGLDFNSLPKLEANDANSGSAFSMGIGNHPFYEDCKVHDETCSSNNPYFGVLLDADGKWLDSHKIGIDGPLLHLDKNDLNLLHIWLLSFERQALVGHYTIKLN